MFTNILIKRGLVVVNLVHFILSGIFQTEGFRLEQPSGSPVFLAIAVTTPRIMMREEMIRRDTSGNTMLGDKQLLSDSVPDIIKKTEF